MRASQFKPLVRPAALIAAPMIAIIGARAMTYTEWAAAHTTLAALLFAWIAADALCLTTIAKAPEFKPGPAPMLGALTLAGVVVIVGAGPAVRERIFDMHSLLAAIGLTAALWLCLASTKVVNAKRSGEGWEAALSAVLPSAFLHFFFTELRMMHLALFRWGSAPDIPRGAEAFSYSRYLTPMLVALGVLQVIELGVVHLLLMLWNPAAAWIVFALTLAGLLWFVALTKSMRLMPVLLEEDAMRVRAGTLIDFEVAYANIAAVGEAFTAETLMAKTTCNTAILSSPNVTLRLARPVAVERPFGAPRLVDRVALRLDEPAAFLAALEARLTR